MQHSGELSLRPLRSSDAEILADAFAALGWSKPEELFHLYLGEQGEGQRWVSVAEWDHTVAPRVLKLRLARCVDCGSDYGCNI